MNKQIALALLSLGILTGCSLAPTYVRPDAPVSANFADAEKSVSGRPSAKETQWRTFFTEPRLQALITTALEQNRDLRMAALRIEEARALYDIQSADRLPNVNGNMSGARARTPVSLSSTGNPVVSSNYQVGLSLASFELDFFGRVRSLNEAALAQYLATEHARQAAQMSLIAEVAKAYLTERALAEQFELAKKTLEGRQATYQFTQQRFDAGASSALDVRLSETLMLSARTSLSAFERQRAQAANALTLLVGKPLNDFPHARSFSEQQLATDLSAGLPSDLLSNRPDIQAAEQRLKATNANIGAARAAFFPRIALTSSIGTASNALSGLFETGSRSWTFAPQLTLPIFDAGRNNANLTLAQVRNNIAVADYEKSIQVAFREVADTLAARSALDAQLSDQTALRDAQADRLRLADLRFKNGIASAIDVLDAQREMYTAEQSLVQTHLLRLTNAIDFYRALGGGLPGTTTPFY